MKPAWLSRKLWFAVLLQCCAMYSAYAGYVNGEQLVTWSTLNGLYYMGGNVGTGLSEALKSLALVYGARRPE